jgi:hypothetical protein
VMESKGSRRKKEDDWVGEREKKKASMVCFSPCWLQYMRVVRRFVLTDQVGVQEHPLSCRKLITTVVGRYSTTGAGHRREK